MATKIIRRDIRPHRAADGRLLGYYEDLYYVGDPPPATRPAKQLRTTQQATPARQPKTPAPVAFLHMGRLVTLEYCLQCHQRHAHCQCWPACNVRQLTAEAAAAAAPYTRENTFSAVVRRQQELGLRPGETPTTTHNKSETTLEAVVRLQRERGLR